MDTQRKDSMCKVRIMHLVLAPRDSQKGYDLMIGDLPLVERLIYSHVRASEAPFCCFFERILHTEDAHAPPAFESILR